MKLFLITLFNIVLISSVYGMEPTQSASWFTRMRQKAADTYSSFTGKINQNLFPKVEYTTYSEPLIYLAYEEALEKLIQNLILESPQAIALEQHKSQLLNTLEKEESEGKKEPARENITKSQYFQWRDNALPKLRQEFESVQFLPVD